MTENGDCRPERRPHPSPPAAGAAAALLALPRPPGWGWASRLAERASGLARIADLYARRPPALAPAAFIRFALEQVDLRWQLASGELDRLPAAGALIVIANHPFGAADGLVLADLLLRRRRDVLLLANRWLAGLPELAPLVAPVDVFRAGASLAGVRQALRHLDAGGALVVFPAGEVSRWQWSSRRVADPRWADSVAMLARRSGAPVLPVRIEGRAEWRSIAAGILHPRLRTACLARDLLRLQGRRLPVHLGEPVAADEIGALDPAAQTAFLRLLTYSLGGRRAPAPPPPRQPVAAAVPVARLVAEVAGLPPSARLCAAGTLEVYCAQAEQIPAVLDEIGRLRELSFRAVDEGSGRARDLDRFDADYAHLFVWDAARGDVVGAYRLGYTETLRRSRGLAGLYTHTLFDYGPELLDRIGPALELGRSFVRSEWQRNFRALRLLWSGIATILDREPGLRCLFGPVSISPRYSAAGQALIRAALRAHHSDPGLAALVRPRTPPREPPGAPEVRQVGSALADSARLSRVLARLERGAGLPVLVRHYLDLNGRFAGFNVDADFGGTLDGLVFVDVADIPARVRAKFAAPGRTGAGGADRDGA